CPQHQKNHRRPPDSHSARSRARIRPHARQHFPGRTLPRAAFLPSPRPRLGLLPYSGRQPLYVRFRHPSRRRYHGRSRPHRQPGHSQRLEQRFQKILAFQFRETFLRVSPSAAYGDHPAPARLRREKLTMPLGQRVVLIGGGHNALVTAFYLAKGGFKPLILERREFVGGAAITEEFHPGFRASTLAHTVGPLRPDIPADLQVEKYEWHTMHPNPRLFAPTPDGKALLFYNSHSKTAGGIARFSAKDAA